MIESLRVQVSPVRAMIRGVVFELEPELVELPEGTVTVELEHRDEQGPLVVVARDAAGEVTQRTTINTAPNVEVRP